MTVNSLTITSATPLPAALPMFGSALGLAGGYFGWRRKKKAAA
jgi:LPXTG-motif cell wall-anchored protein